MRENNLYALNQVSQCNISPENLEVSRAKITMYTKHFRQDINATVCRVKYQSEQWHCGFRDDSSMDAHHTGGITIDLTVRASQCRTLARGGSITLKDETLEFKKGVKTTVVKHKDFDDNGADLSDKYRKECDSHGWIKRKTFEGHVQDVVLKVRTKDGKVMSKDGLQLPCPLEELGCDTTSFDPYAYTWDASDNCVLAIHRLRTPSRNKAGLSVFRKLKNARRLRDTTSKEPMRTRKNSNFNYLDALNGKSTTSWLYVNRKSLYVPQYRRQPRLAISLHFDAFSTTCDEPMLRQNPYLLQKFNLLRRPNHSTNIPRCSSSELIRPD